ncbi:helicase-like transcription factor CHR27 [Drosophila teissieri]|uniref:helicase-like transcription factor CHR27 n=1 Tax=Drosophila teissieri TaxID=7243 RepID=UPI001CBA4107|nr:helicase-like transcription factor CHR27 [Drosophila teissieri]
MPQIFNSDDKRKPKSSNGGGGDGEEPWMDKYTYYVCMVCMQTAESPRVSFCGHHFCAKCICNWIKTQEYRAKCPYCQSLIGENTLITIRNTHHTNTVESSSSCRSLGEHRLMRMRSDYISEQIILPEAVMFTRGHIKYPADPMPRIKPLAPQMLQQWSRLPIERQFVTPSLHQRFITFALFLLLLAMYQHMARVPA